RRSCAHLAAHLSKGCSLSNLKARSGNSGPSSYGLGDRAWSGPVRSNFWPGPAPRWSGGSGPRSGRWQHPGRRDETEHLCRYVSHRSPVIQLERWRRGREEAQGTFHVRLVLSALHGGANANGVAERGVDLGGVVRWSVVEQLGERSRARRRDAVLEGLDDGRRVLLVANRDADEGSREGITLQLEVELHDFTADGDGHAHAVTDPLRAGKESLKAAAQGEL